MLIAWLTLAHAHPSTLTVVVSDPSGAPVPTAEIQFRMEPRDRVEVDAAGVAVIDALYPRDHGTWRLEKGSTLHFAVTAPGMALALGTVKLKKRQTHLEVTLSPADPAAEWVGNPAMGDAVARFRTWEDAKRAHVASPTDATRAAVLQARTEAGAAAQAVRSQVPGSAMFCLYTGWDCQAWVYE